MRYFMTKPGKWIRPETNCQQHHDPGANLASLGGPNMLRFLLDVELPAPFVGG